MAGPAERSPGTRTRVGYVLKMYPRLSETFVLTEILALEDRGAELEVFSLRPPVDGHFHEALARVRAPVTYLPVPYRPLPLWETLRRGEAALPGRVGAALPDLLATDPADAAQAVELACLVAERRLDHLHAHFGSLATSVARLAARLAEVGYSFTAHAKDIFHADVDPADLRRKLADAAAVVTVSDYNLRFLRARYGAAAHGVRRVYNGLDLDELDFGSPVSRPAVVAGVGRLVEKKGFADLVSAVALLHDAGREVRLDLVGGGPEEEALRRQVAGLGLEDRVRLHGPLPQGATRRVVREAAALAAPCVVAADGNRDGLPTVLLEGLALGTPVVSTPVTGVPEAVRDGVTGLLVPEHDPVALAGALDLLVSDAGLRCRLAVAGRAHVERHFDVRRNAATLHGLLDSAAAHRRAPGRLDQGVPR